MYVFGGYTGREHSNRTYVFDPAANTWALCRIGGGPGPCARRRQCTVRVGTRVFVFGGTCPQGNQQQNLVDLCDLHVLDYGRPPACGRPIADVSLCTLCSMSVIAHNRQPALARYCPRNVCEYVRAMCEPNSITPPAHSHLVNG